MEIRLDPEDRIAVENKKPSKAPILIALVIALAAISGTGYWAWQQQLEKEALRERLRIAWEEAEAAEAERQDREAAERNKKPKAIHYDDVTSPLLEQWEREREQKRQTVFNDQNYRPRPAQSINRMPATPTYRPPPAPEPRERPQPVTVTKWAPWSHSGFKSGSGFRSSTTGGRFSYVVQDGAVVLGTICANETYGSIRYRECRKGAKKYFDAKCRGPYKKEPCSGANMRP